MRIRLNSRLTIPRPGRAGLLAFMAFAAFAYGRPFAAAVLEKWPQLAPLLCGGGHQKSNVSGAASVAVWTECTGAATSPASAVGFPLGLWVFGAACLFLAGLAVLLLVSGAVARVSDDPGGDTTADRPKAVGLLRSILGKRSIGILAAALMVAAAVAVPFTAIAVQNLHRVPAAGLMFCASGHLHPSGLRKRSAFGSSRGSLYLACKDDNGLPIDDERLHYAVAQSIYAVSAVGLWTIFAFAALILRFTGKRGILGSTRWKVG